MQQRKSSCLNCRNRKVKCDKKETCSKCLKTKSICVYQKVSNLGRPPKNTVFYGKNKNNNVQTLGVREFIFEHMNNPNHKNNNCKNKNKKLSQQITTTAIPPTTTTPTNSSMISDLLNNEWWILSKQNLTKHQFIYECFQSIYYFYLIRGYSIRDRFSSVTYQLPEKPKFKFYCLKRFFTWWASLSVNILLRRTSRFKLETYTVPSLALYMFQMNDAQHNINTFTSANPFFLHQKQDTSNRQYQELRDNSMNNPLQSLPPEQAMTFIESFFCVHPFSILINKTKLINDYWSDTATPLLLSVIYGTTLCFNQHLQGLPVALWESANEENRNPFLNYAYHLLRSSPITASADTYRAIVILALFENLWGYSKLGMSLLSTSYVVGTLLGLWDYTYKSSDPIEEELVNMTFWAAYRTTTHGCIELGCNIVDTLIHHQRPFPPANIADSLSFLYDHSHNNIKSTNQYTYMYETYYAGAVISYYSGILFACLPKPLINIFGIPTSKSTFTGSSLLASLRDIEDLETRLYTILDDFANFIQQHKYQWSSIQLFTIKMTYLLYRIHFRFLRSALTNGKLKEQEDLIPDATEACINFTFIDLEDVDTKERLHKVLPDLLELVNDLENILIGDTIIKTASNRIFLPGEIIVTAFETCVQLLMMNYQLQPTKAVHDALIKLSIVSKKRDEYRAARIALKNISQRLHMFLKRHHHQSYVKQKSLPPPPSSSTLSNPPSMNENNINMSNHSYLNMPSQSPSSSSSTASSSTLKFCNTNHHHQQPLSSPSSLSSSPSIISSTAPIDILSYQPSDINLDNIMGDNDGHYDLFGMEDSNFIDWDNLTTNIFDPYEMASYVEQDQSYHVC